MAEASTFTFIGNDAFSNNANVTKLFLPLSVEKIGDRAFSGCSRLENVDFKSGENLADESILSEIGNLVFEGDTILHDNALVRLLVEDTDVTKKFSRVGYGIFEGTKVVDPNSDYKIVWRNHVLHTYNNGNRKTFTFNEEYIEGHAFVNLGNNNPADKLTIEITNANVKIASYAFEYLNSSINKIDVTRVPYSNLNNVKQDAFGETGMTIEQSLDVRTSNSTFWLGHFAPYVKNQKITIDGLAFGSN